MYLKSSKTSVNPWCWIPTLYFAEGIPYFVVNNISVLMFAKMGVPNGEMSLFTSLLYLPWVIKPLWSPFIDIFRTKRWWIISMQVIMSVAFILSTLTLTKPSMAIIQSGQTPMSIFSVTLFLFIVTAFASATHDIAADGFYMLALSQKDQSLFVGIRSTFYRLSNIFGNGVLVAIAGFVENKYSDVPLSWQITLGTASLIFTVVTLWHLFAVPRPTEDMARFEDGGKKDADALSKEFVNFFITFFTNKGIKGVILAIAFMLLYRLPEAFLLKLCTPFLVADSNSGGLAMSTQDVGFAYGTIGVIFLTIGGIVGGIMASRWGLRKSLWPMAASMTFPCLSFVYLAISQTSNLWVISSCIAIEQFGYGFGFTAYMLYMMYFSEGEYKTGHYAICTAFMALSMMIPGMFAGFLQESLGYVNFFWFVMFCCLATFGVTYFVHNNLKS